VARAASSCNAFAVATFSSVFRLCDLFEKNGSQFSSQLVDAFEFDSFGGQKKPKTASK